MTEVFKNTPIIRNNVQIPNKPSQTQVQLKIKQSHKDGQWNQPLSYVNQQTLNQLTTIKEHIQQSNFQVSDNQTDKLLQIYQSSQINASQKAKLQSHQVLKESDFQKQKQKQVKEMYQKTCLRVQTVKMEQKIKSKQEKEQFQIQVQRWDNQLKQDVENLINIKEQASKNPNKKKAAYLEKNEKFQEVKKEKQNIRNTLKSRTEEIQNLHRQLGVDLQPRMQIKSMTSFTTDRSRSLSNKSLPRTANSNHLEQYQDLEFLSKKWNKTIDQTKALVKQQIYRTQLFTQYSNIQKKQIQTTRPNQTKPTNENKQQKILDSIIQEKRQKEIEAKIDPFEKKVKENFFTISNMKLLSEAEKVSRTHNFTNLLEKKIKQNNIKISV